MYVLKRKAGDKLLFVGRNLRAQIKILNVEGDGVTLGVRILKKLATRPASTEHRRADDREGRSDPRNATSRRSRRPRLLWPPVEAQAAGRY